MILWNLRVRNVDGALVEDSYYEDKGIALSRESEWDNIEVSEVSITAISVI